MRVKQLRDRLRTGVPFSGAFSALVPETPAYVSRLLAAGEAGGRLGDVVSRLAASLGRAKALRDRLVSGLLYPTILLAAMVAVLWIVFSTVLPRLVPMFEDAGAALPESTAFLLAIDRLFSDHGWLILAAFCAAVAGLVYALSRPGGRRAVDRFLLTSRITLRLPANYEAARFCRTLQMLLEGGLSIEKALALARDSAANSWFAHNLDAVRRSVIEGKPLHAALQAQDTLPRLVVEFAAVGEETGRLDTMIGEVADVLDKAVETSLDRLAALVVPVTTLILGALVSGIMAGVVSGILAVNDLAR
jgi:general secretion pathway protein F